MGTSENDTDDAGVGREKLKSLIDEWRDKNSVAKANKSEWAAAKRECAGQLEILMKNAK